MEKFKYLLVAAVATSAVAGPAFAQTPKPGAPIKVTYVEKGEQRIIKSIVKG